MTREETKELLPIIQAFAEGKKIEYYDYRNDDWIETSTPVWPVGVKYRIKPEPKYRPFKTKEECWNEMMKHQPFGWLNGSPKYRLISSIGDVYIWLTDKVYYTFEEVFNFYTFADGTPFGIKED